MLIALIVLRRTQSAKHIPFGRLGGIRADSLLFSVLGECEKFSSFFKRGKFMISKRKINLSNKIFVGKNLSRKYAISKAKTIRNKMKYREDHRGVNYSGKTGYVIFV